MRSVEEMLAEIEARAAPMSDGAGLRSWKFDPADVPRLVAALRHSLAVAKTMHDSWQDDAPHNGGQADDCDVCAAVKEYQHLDVEVARILAGEPVAPLA